MNREELIIWLDALKPGDTVAVFELGGGGSLLSVNTVERRTKSGRIVCDSGMVFTKNGTLFGSPGYDEAVRYVFEKRRKRKNERFQLMYLLGNAFHAVSTLDDILAIDKAHDEEQRAIEAQRAQLRAEFDKDLPGLNALQKVTGRQTAYAASELLKKMQDDGVEAAKASIPPSSYYRLVKALRAAGLMPA